MVFFGWIAEIGTVAPAIGFLGGMCMWLYIVFETFGGEAAGHARKLVSPASIQAFNYLRLIVGIGWIIYPAGFAYTYFGGGVHSESGVNALDVTYNLADFVN